MLNARIAATTQRGNEQIRADLRHLSASRACMPSTLITPVLAVPPLSPRTADGEQGQSTDPDECNGRRFGNLPWLRVVYDLNRWWEEQQGKWNCLGVAIRSLGDSLGIRRNVSEPSGVFIIRSKVERNYPQKTHWAHSYSYDVASRAAFTLRENESLTHYLGWQGLS